MRFLLLAFGHPVLLACVVFSLLSSCKKEDNTNVGAQVALVHAAPGVVNMDVVVSGTVQVPGFFYKNVTSGTNTPYRSFTRAENAPWSLRMNYSGTNTELASAVPTWTGGRYYSVAIYDTLPDLKLLLLEDDLATPPDGFAKVRFVNTMRKLPEAAVLTLNGTPVSDGVAYGTASAYLQIASGSVVANVRSAGVEQLNADGAAVNLQSGKIYTVYATGISALPFTSPWAPSLVVVRSN